MRNTSGKSIPAFSSTCQTHDRGIIGLCRVTTLWLSLAAVGLTPARAQEPNAGGVLRLGRHWQWASTRTDSGTLPGHLVAEGTVDVSLLPVTPKQQRTKGSWFIWCDFATPAAWTDRPVWLTYDGTRLCSSAISEVWLNGEPLSIAVPRHVGAGFVQRTRWRRTHADDPEPGWFADVGPKLRRGSPNRIVFRVGIWPLIRNAGVWMYCVPKSERVLFLVSRDVTPEDDAKVVRWVAHVRANFAVDPWIVRRSFDGPMSLRQWLISTYRAGSFSGVVLIGTHPMVAYDFHENEKYGSQPRFFEDLDVGFNDTDRDGHYDQADLADGFGIEIWSAWVRKPPRAEAHFTAFLDKILDYYEGRMFYPGRRVVGSCDMPGDPDTGLDHYDLFMRPTDYAVAGGHGGAAHAAGPHRVVPWRDALQLYPGAPVVRINGCGSGNILGSRPCLGEHYLYGRGNAVAVMTFGTSEGGDNPRRHVGVRDELLAISPHLGPMYTYLVDLKGDKDQHYLSKTSFILLGNPFVSFSRSFSGRAATIAGTVTGASALPLPDVYVSACRGDTCLGRVRTGSDGRYQLDCLPPGRYDLRVNLNVRDQVTRSLTLRAEGVTEARFVIQDAWTISGQVFDADGGAVKDSWCELAERAADEAFVAADLFGVRVDDRGQFLLHGLGEAALFIRACKAGVTPSDPVRIDGVARQKQETVVLRLGGSLRP